MSEVDLLVRGRASELSDASLDALVDRAGAFDDSVASTVAELVRDVRERGDDALVEMARRFDGVELHDLEVPRTAWNEALAELDTDVRAALERAARNIGTFHAAQRPDDVTLEVESGVRVTRKWVALPRVGVYAPGGTAAYPSSVLMGAVAARSAGVDEVVVCSPPGPVGRPPAEVLAACAIAGVDRLFALGGAGAVAAMAYGTERVPVADAIVGPGNRWVTEAKRQVAGHLVIDAPAGPSEVLVLADSDADPRLVALELLAQAEHDADAACVLVTTSNDVADAAVAELARLLIEAPRAEIARRAFASAGGVVVFDSMDEALAFTDRFAAEHLSIMTADAREQAFALRHAGTTFVGGAASVAFGDYMTGGNHVLPTSGRARSFSGLAVHHFMRSFTIQEIDDDGAAAMAGDVALLARSEGLPAHALAAEARARRRDGE